MTGEWYRVPYPTGPAVQVAGFPRPLYPPDAEELGKKPSAPGPDVEAVKRTVSRMGRWPWQKFDRQFSNAFAHGKSGNVGETGVAGIQRQQHLDATGFVGVQTFNLLRSARVPEGLPHAGELAMDAIAIGLMNDAWEMFGGHEPADEPGKTVRRAALELAITQLGVKESPPSSNHNQYGVWYGVDRQPWCAMFATWCYEKAAAELGKDSPSFVRGSRYAYVPYIVGDARAARNGLVTVDADQVQPGDLVAYDWQGDSIYDHVGLFEKWVEPGLWSAIEGNTSYSSNSNGGEVMRRQRSRVGQATVFVRVAEP